MDELTDCRYCRTITLYGPFEPRIGPYKWNYNRSFYTQFVVISPSNLNPPRMNVWIQPSLIEYRRSISPPVRCRVRLDRQERRRPDPLRRVRRLGPRQEPRPRGRRRLKKGVNNRIIEVAESVFVACRPFVSMLVLRLIQESWLKDSNQCQIFDYLWITGAIKNGFLCFSQLIVSFFWLNPNMDGEAESEKLML